MSTDLSSLIRANREHLSNSSIRTYVSILNNLKKKLNLSDALNKAGITKHVNAILDSLKEKTPKQRKTVLSALVVMLDDGHASDVLNQIRHKMMSDSQKADEEDSKQEMTTSQAENWMSWSDVEKKYAELEKKVKPLWKLEEIPKAVFRFIQQYVILSCFVRIKPRRSQDWLDFKIHGTIDPKKDNYMKGNKLVFNSFKTKKYLGQQEVDCPPALKKIFTDWARINTHDNLLVDTKGKPMSASQFTQELYSIFDKNISTNMLRHIYLSNLLKDVPKLQELQSTMKDMGQTDLETQMKYVKREKTSKK